MAQAGDRLLTRRPLYNRVAPAGDRTTCTVTALYSDGPRTVCDRSRAACLAQLERRYGPPERVLSVSTPWSIYQDLTGATKRRHAAEGLTNGFLGQTGR